MQKKILLFNGFPFHHEMFGYFIEYCKNHDYQVYIHDRHIDNSWNLLYETAFNDSSFQINYKNDLDINIVRSFDNVVVLTDDDYNYPDPWVNSKTITIDHHWKIRRSNIRHHLGIRPFLNKTNPFAIPAFQMITKEQKIERLAKQDKINICCVGGVHMPHNMEELKFITDSNNNIHVHIINRRINKCLQNQKNATTYENIDTVSMFEVLLNSHYMLLLDHNNDHVQGLSMSASIPTSMTTGCQLIMPKQMNDVGFNYISAITYEKGESVVLNNLNLDGVFNDREQIIINRDISITYLLNQTLPKKLLCFYIGFTNINTQAFYGSELALINMCKLFEKTYDVYIVGHSNPMNDVRGIPYMNINNFRTFQKSNEIDILVISRYINYFIECDITAKQTYIWAHDNIFLPFIGGGHNLPQHGKYLIHNVLPRITKIIALTEWHRNNLITVYEIPTNSVEIIGNGLETDIINRSDISTIEKIKNRFIYTSSPERGLVKLVEYFHEIKKEIEDAELYVFRGLACFNTPELQELLKDIEKCEYIHYGGGIDHDQVLIEFEKSDFWLYPTDWAETYCISALEALNAGCMCIASNYAALKNIVADRGILLKSKIYSDDFKQECIKRTVYVAKNDNIKQMYQTKGREWAKKQTWANRALEWQQLFDA